jgi:acyl-CoA synthetase (AMP-forming)/AMP-acid ligase II
VTDLTVRTKPLEATTVGQLVRAAAGAYGERTAVVGSGVRLSFSELDERSRRLALRLVRRGVTKGAHVGISFGNGPDFVVALLGVTRIGAVAVPVSTFAPGRELRRLLRHADITGLLTARSVVGVDQVDRLTSAVEGLRAARTPTLALTEAPNLRWIEVAGGDSGELPAWATHEDDTWLDVAAGDDLLDALEADVHPSDTALMIHTSGTTADPKGVPHLHDTVCFRAAYLAERMQYREGERTYTSQVLFWIGGLVMSCFTCLASGGTSIWSERFDAGDVLALIEHERVERLVIYPHQVEQLLQHPAFASTDRSSLRVADPRLVAGEPEALLTPEGHRMALGMSETFGPFSWGSAGDGVIGAIEDVQPGLEVRVVDEANVPVGDGGTGEIVLRGRGLTPGYYKRLRSSAFDADGWFHTGDRGRVDGGAIHFLGRMTEMIKTAGANVAPAEVVDALLALDGVREAYVLPLPDAERGELVGAAVVVDPDTAVDADAIRDALRRDLSPFKVPARIAFLRSEEIPWTPTFKVRRHELVDLIAERAR